MDIYVGRQKHTLNPQRDFVAQGGEGSIYIKGGIAYKIYADPAKMLPAGKLQELSVLDYPGMVRPQEIVRDSTGQPVGYTMKAVPQAYPLCRTFTRSFRDQYRLGPAEMLALVRELQNGVALVHSHGLLIVDLNEMNFLVSADFARVFFLDVDSYQTPHYPATALMETVRDRHHATFSEGTDWFSFAVVSFQMFIGIHPYKGKHATLKTLEERMIANVSVLNTRQVTIPAAACQPFSILPRAYRAWYEAVLENGERCPPPHSPASVVLVSSTAARPPTVIAAADMLDMQTIAVFGGEDILATLDDIVLTTGAIYVKGRKVRDLPASFYNRLHLARAEGPGQLPVLAYTEDGRLRLVPLLSQKTLTAAADLRADALSSANGRLYARQGGHLVEIMLRETPVGILVQPRVIGNVLEQATQLFEGVALQNLLGACYASLLPHSGVCQQIRLTELDGCRIVEARFEGGVLMVVASAKDGSYDKYIFRIDENGSYTVRIVRDVSDLAINFTTLDSGVCLHHTGSDTLELFSAKPGSDALNTVTDPALGAGETRLLHCGVQARFIRGSGLYAFSLKKRRP